jgi:hypothetical protein
VFAALDLKMNKKKTYCILSIYLSALGLLFYFMVLRELLYSHDTHGTYINFLLNNSIPPNPGQAIEMCETSPWLLSEERIVTLFYMGFITASLLSVVSGLFAYIKNEPTRIYSGSIAISSLLLIN